VLQQAFAVVATDRRVLPLPLSVLRGVGPFLINPLNRRCSITLTFKQFTYSWANALDEDEAKELYETFHVAGSGIALAQMGNANLNRWTQAKVDTKNPDRGPLLIIDGEKDHTVPWAIAHAAYKRQRRDPGVTEIVKIPNRGHALTIDHGWREVAHAALDFVERSRRGDGVDAGDDPATNTLGADTASLGGQSSAQGEVTPPRSVP
jgi:pimeloyl-ACP methyl ester carboxylesterase